MDRISLKKAFRRALLKSARVREESSSDMIFFPFQCSFGNSCRSSLTFGTFDDLVADLDLLVRIDVYDLCNANGCFEILDVLFDNVRVAVKMIARMGHADQPV